MKSLKVVTTALAVTLALAGGGAIAHTDEILATMHAPHGGQLRLAGLYHFELVIDRQADGKQTVPVKVYVTDHGGTPSDIAAVKGKLTLLGSSGRGSADLVPVGTGVLSAQATYVADRKLKAIVTLNFPDGRVEQARFLPLDPQ